MTHDERIRLAEDYAQQLYNALQEILPQSPNESDFRCQVDNLLKSFCRAAGIDAPAHTEYTLACGRADAVFNRLILEYKQPGRLGDSLYQSRRQSSQIAANAESPHSLPSPPLSRGEQGY
jgi:hypothetical protein